MTWHSLVLVLLLAAFTTAVGVRAIVQRRVSVALERDGRVISWNEALDHIRTGSGMFVENHTSLPGRLWWIEAAVELDQAELYETVEAAGFRVLEAPTPDQVRRLAIDEGYGAKLKRLDAEPFSD